MDVHELLDAYLDDELTVDERVSVETALADSPELAEELAERTVVRSLLRDLPEVEPPAGFYEAMLERGTADPKAELPNGVASLSGARVNKDEQARAKRSLTSRLTSIVAAAAVFLLVLGFGSGISAIERVPALDDFANRHAEALSAMNAGVDAETARFSAMPMEEAKGMGPSGTNDLDMMGAYETDDKILQLIYSDGTGNIISVFRQDGFVKADGMPNSEILKMAGNDAWHLESGDYDTLVVDHGGITYTLLGGLSSSSAMESLASDLPDNGVLDSVQSFCRDAMSAVGIN